MSGSMQFALIAIALCLVVLCAGAIALGLRAAAIAKRARKLESHPTLVAARRAPEIVARFDAVKDRLSEARDRGRSIGDDVGKILASLAVLGLNVDRVAFATKLFLSTFVPTLGGLMADDG